ncbi:hypothetical protein M378DRAFT_87088 [Amanita muscaria Koide BX008]|uniref:Uncharacterized protein n=1 Tax=Amanita muscaria (strain Koide BX008) TaxID=946122 RepID=A0A0C2SVD3_AMAMK|nr:hypothetical protein M378DRAFT_87088 [Amanita muscaria Koide BX008]
MFLDVHENELTAYSDHADEPNNDSDRESDWENDENQSIFYRATSPVNKDGQRSPAEFEDITYHPNITVGRPCNQYGEFLPAGTPPAPWEDLPCTDFSPFDDREDFELAELLYQRTQMPKSDISDLMQIWARKSARSGMDVDPPFANCDELYATIDSIEHGDIPWQSFVASYSESDADASPSEDPAAEPDDAPWKHAAYDIWFRDPLAILKQQLSNRDFAGEMDFSPKRVLAKASGKRRYHDMMSGNWAWRQADVLSQNPENHGATFCPVILGSDKTTVSVATGQNDYYPVYLSNGLIHNAVRRAHRNGVTPVAFLAIPKTDREHHNSDEFRNFRRHLFHSSLKRILTSLRPVMEDFIVLQCADGHYRRVIFGLGPYIGDYPEQVLVSCIVQGWCSRCTAKSKDLDGLRGRRSHEHTGTLRLLCPTNTLWSDYGIINGITPFTAHFPRADIHELISPDILHQLVKGVFKDHLVSWVEDYVKLSYPKAEAARILAEIDRRIAAAPPFTNIRRFKDGRGFKQWTGQDSKALMKVYLPAIAGLVPPRMVRAVHYFIEFCYHVRREVLDDDDLETLDNLLASFHREREMFMEEGVRPTGFNLPRQHALTHYRDLIFEFGAPNGVCSSITESRHRTAVKDPYRRSSRNEPLAEILLVNQRMDKLAAARVNFVARGMLDDSGFLGHRETPQRTVQELQRIQDEDDDGGAVDGHVLSEVLMARKAVPGYPRRVDALATMLNLPNLREDISRFLYDQEHPDRDPTIPLNDIPIQDCSEFRGKIFVYPSAVATYYAPSDMSGTGGMYRERIRSTNSWRKGPERRDCVLVEHDPNSAGFRGLHIAQVQLFFKIKYKRVFSYPCALVNWFSPIGNEPCHDTGMWRVKPDFAADGTRTTTVIHLDSILRAAHLVGIAGEDFLPYHLKFVDSLRAFKSFYVNKFIDYHAHETAF